MSLIRARSVAVWAALLALPGTTRADERRPAERWSAAATIGVEALPDSTGSGLEPMALYGAGGTIRLHRLACLDARLGLGTAEDGSATTRMEETRLRIDVRGALCPSLSPWVTVLAGLGPAFGLSLFKASLGRAETDYSATDLGASLDAGVLLRLGPVLVRADLEAAVLGRIVLGAFFGVGVAL